MKRVIVEAMFPELKGSHLYRTGRGQGRSARVATARAFANLYSQVKGKRFQIVKATVTIIDAVPQLEPQETKHEAV